LVAIALLTVVLLGLKLFGQAAYDAGYKEAEVLYTQALMEAAQNRADAMTQLQAERERADALAARRTEERVRVVFRTREEIANAPDTEARYAAYLGLRERLRNESAERHARAQLHHYQ